jgi:serine-type D-Ala-D-Ala carboxypeptidase/endopeptidase (penicillin-binding protein 4)
MHAVLHLSWPAWSRVRPVLLGLALAGTCVVAEPVPASDASSADAALAERLAARLAVPALSGARVSALVVEDATGRVLFERDKDRALVPASNMKVLTGVAVLAALGPAHRFTTEVLAPAPPDADGAVTALYVRGGGDPALTSEQWWRLAADLRLRGLVRVAGDLVVDDGLFDAEWWHPSWGSVSARAYHAPVGALMANYGAFRIQVAPGAPDAPAVVRLDPPVASLRLVSRVTTTARGAPNLTVERVPAGAVERIVVTGSVPADGEPVELWRSVADPTRYAAEVLRMQLAAHGIEVAGGLRREPVPPEAVSLLAFQGLPLAEISRLFLKHSNNAVAEALLKYLGLGAAGAAPGRRGAGWALGVQEQRRVLTSLGIDLDGTRLVDGSGLSRENRVSAKVLVDALRRARRSFDFGPELMTAVPIAASDGTLERRAGAAAGRVRAKTGLLSGVTGLSGYARTGDDRELVFSVLVNGYARGDWAAMDALDGFAAALVH